MLELDNTERDLITGRIEEAILLYTDMPIDSVDLFEDVDSEVRFVLLIFLGHVEFDEVSDFVDNVDELKSNIEEHYHTYDAEKQMDISSYTVELN